MKIEFKNMQSKIELGTVVKKIAGFINSKESLVVLLILFVFIGYTGYLWYQYAYNYQWSEVKKQEYMNTRSAINSFDKINFEKLI